MLKSIIEKHLQGAIKKVVDPRQQLIKKVYKVNAAEELGKLETSDCCNWKQKMPGKERVRIKLSG